MSQKNHEMIDGKLLQINKKYSALKLKQKEKIAEWMFQETKDFYTKKYTFPNDKQLSKVVDRVYDQIEKAEIWISYDEVFKHYKSKRSNINKRVRKALNEKAENLPRFDDFTVGVWGHYGFPCRRRPLMPPCKTLSKERAKSPAGKAGLFSVWG